MARINPQLLDRLKSKLSVGRAQIYKLIDAKVRSAHLPRPLAAIALAAERGISISKFANADDLAVIRLSRSSSAPAAVILPPVTTASSNSGRMKSKTKRKTAVEQRRGTTVFVVHGRNLATRNAVFTFLRAVGCSRWNGHKH